MASSWTCSRCTFINTVSLKPDCQICSSSPLPSSLPSSSSNQETGSCTFLNPYKESSCEICRTRYSSFLSDLRLEDEELEAFAVDNVFFPLPKIAKRKIQDEPIGVDSDPVDFGASRGFKSANRNVDGSYTAVAHDSIDRPLVAFDETRPKEELRMLKILSYNVWFAEDLELRIRMKSISDIIQLHSPDVICLQEVTPKIYFLLQRSNWWKSYKCSLSFHEAIMKGYFCMQLSKLCVKSFSCKQFSYSAMGRELCITEVSTQEDTPLVVATSHLESPSPGPPKWDQTYSKERVKQANEAVDFLKKNPNVIFCGDMNWDDKLDGEFPLPEGWVDAWTELKPKEIGWTYDTKSNLMLTSNRKRQKRFDRVLISLRDFKAECINMVGTESIPGVTHMKRRKGKELVVPVFPSDHFGLLLTISAP